MGNDVNNFINELRGFKSTTADVFNPWRDYDGDLDLCPEAPNIRAKQLEHFLHGRLPRAKYLLVAEAVGYQGGRFTGVPLVSERIILGNHPEIKPADISLLPPGRRTSNPNHQDLKNTQRIFGFTEPTATIIWNEILKNQVPPCQMMTWNIFPFHPFNPNKGPLSNRTPTTVELEIGVHYTELLLDLCPGITVIAIGSHSARTLDKSGIAHIHVPHPANGGANKFRTAIKKMLTAG